MSTRRARVKRHARRAGLAVVAGSLLAFVLSFALLILATGRPIGLPSPAVNWAEGQVNTAMAGMGAAELGGIEFFLESGWRPRFRLRDMEVTGPNGRHFVTVPELRVVLDRDALLQARVLPQTITISGATIEVLRLEDGRFDIDFGGTGAELTSLDALPDFLATVNAIFDMPILAGLRAVEVADLSLHIEDRRAGRDWTVHEGDFRLTNGAEEIRLDMGIALDASETSYGRATMNFVTRKDSPQSELHAQFFGVPARDVGLQTPELAWLGVVDAPISGGFRARILADGTLAPVEGRLEIASGVLRPAGNLAPIPLRSALLTFAFDTEAERFEFTEIRVQSKALALAATGHALLEEVQDGVPNAVTVQIDISELLANPDGVFATPAKFERGLVDFRLRLDPFSLRVGQAVLLDGGEKLRASADISGGDGGWNAAMDFSLNRIQHERLLALWPQWLVPRTREWLSENVFTAQLFNVDGALRLRPGEEPVISMGWEMNDAEVRILRTLPPIVGGAGRATLQGTVYSMVIDRGRLPADRGGDIDVAGSTFRVPDIRRKPAMAEVSLRASGSVPAALSLLDRPPFEFLSKADVPIDLATGDAKVSADLSFPLVKQLPRDQVDFDVQAELSNLESEKVVRGHLLRAKGLRLTANRQMLIIGGHGELSGVGFDGEWRQGLTAADRGKSRVEAVLEATPAALATFVPGLPPGTMTGKAQARLAVDLVKGSAPRMTLSSDLAGAGLTIPELGWRMAKGDRGRLEVAATLSRPVRVDALDIAMPGLRLAGGRVALTPEGTLAEARFPRAEVGGWFDGAVVLTGRGRNVAPAVTIAGGSMDLRRLPDLPSRPGAQGAGGSRRGVPITARLDRITISDAFYLTSVHADADTGGGPTGRFSARLNGTAPVTGRLFQQGGTAIELQAEDAGGVLIAAGIGRRSSGGALAMTLVPGARRGEREGRLIIRDVVLRDAPVAARLLSAASLVGAIEQLATDGIVFHEIDARFRLTPNALEIRNASATGPSLGVTTEGVYTFAGSRMDLQGVVSPLYLINAPGSLLTRKGEGIFGMVYTLRGPVSAPSVGVNPLSILAPVNLRDLFRSAPPRLSQ